MTVTLELRHYDTPLLRFEAETDAGEPNVRIVWVNEERRALLPLGMEGSDAGLFKWLRGRTVPKNRAYVHNLLSKAGLSINRPMNNCAPGSCWGRCESGSGVMGVVK